MNRHARVENEDIFKGRGLFTVNYFGDVDAITVNTPEMETYILIHVVV